MIAPSYLPAHPGFAFSSRSPPDTLNYVPTPGPSSTPGSPWLGSGRPRIEITFQLSSAVASPPSRPGWERRANWAAELSGGLVGATSGSPILCLSSSTPPHCRGPCVCVCLGEGAKGWCGRLCIQALPGLGIDPEGQVCMPVPQDVPSTGYLTIVC